MSTNILNSKKFLESFESLKGCAFISIKGYESKTSGEIADHVVNVGLSVENAKKTDLNKLQNCTGDDLQNISLNTGIALDICQTALSELLASAEKNLSANIEDRSNQSKGQTDAYITITNSIRLHKDTLQLHVFGQAISKNVIVPGEYKTVKSSDKTLAKKAIKKQLDLRAETFRDFIVGNIETIKINKDTIQICR